MSRRVWAETAVAALVVTGMVTCVLLSAVSLGQMIVPSWDGTYLVLFGALTVVEAFVSFRLYRQFHFYVSGGGRYRLIEILLLLASFHLVSDLVQGYAPFERGFPNLRLPTFALFLIVLLCRQVGTNTVSDLDTIRREEETVRTTGASTGSALSGDTVRDSMQNVSPVVRDLTYRFFGGGILIFLLSGLTQAENSQFLHVTRPDLTGPVVNVLVYFGLGMVMLALIRYATLSIQWATGGNILAPTLPGRWLRYGAVFLAGIALFAFLLPTSYGTELLGVARSGLEQLLSAAGTWFAGIMSHFGLSPPPTRTRPPPQHPPPNFHHPGTGNPPHQKPLSFDWLFLIRAVLFWGAVAALALYLIRGYLAAQRKGGAPAGPPILRRVIAWLQRAWTALRGRAARYAETMRDLIPRREPRDAADEITSLPSRLRLSRMSPRERVLYYFLSVVRRLERRGARRPSQTAIELEAEVGPTLEGARGDLRTLTDAYLEARYSAHPIGPEEAAAAQQSWREVRAALRRAEASPEGDDTSN